MRLATTLALVLPISAAAADWPQYRGPNRDGAAAGFTAPAEWPKQPAAKWSFKVGSTDATPALVGDKLYVFARDNGEEVTTCLSAADGKVVWQDKYPAGVSANGPAGGHPGPRACPAVADGKVVTLGLGAVLSCLDAGTGKVVWRKKPGEELPRGYPGFYTASSPIIVDGMAVAQVGGGGGGRGGPGGGGGGGGQSTACVIALDLATGAEKWKAATEGTGYASPVLLTVGDSKQIVFQTGRSLAAVSAADGKALWKVATPPNGRAYNALSPIVLGDVVIYTGGSTGVKAFKVEKTADGFAAKDHWVNDQFGSNFSTPVVKNDRVYGIAERGTLFCLDAKDGKALWNKPGLASGGYGWVVDAGPVLAVLNSRCDLTVFKDSPAAFEQVAQFRAGDGQTYAAPIFTPGRIYVTEQGEVAALGLE